MINKKLFVIFLLSAAIIPVTTNTTDQPEINPSQDLKNKSCSYHGSFLSEYRLNKQTPLENKFLEEFFKTKQKQDNPIAPYGSVYTTTGDLIDYFNVKKKNNPITYDKIEHAFKEKVTNLSFHVPSEIGTMQCVKHARQSYGCQLRLTPNEVNTRNVLAKIENAYPEQAKVTIQADIQAGSDLFNEIMTTNNPNDAWSFNPTDNMKCSHIQYEGYNLHCELTTYAGNVQDLLKKQKTARQQ